jgi:hypothetical protein
VGAELYDPRFHYRGSRKRHIRVYHGNSWRLDARLRGSIRVLGREGWLSTLPSGSAIIDFRVGGASSGCSYWGLEGHGVSESELRRVATSLELG